MWIRTDENVLLNADKVTYFKIQPVYQQIETYGIMAGIKIKDKWFIVIASNGGGWEHVSVSPEKGKQIPRWEDMNKVKELFFEDNETVIQYIMAKKDNINFKENCLHLWRPTEQTIPTPPKYFV